MTKINWHRPVYVIARRGARCITDEKEWMANDRASRWLNRHQVRRPRRFRQSGMIPATAPSSATVPWE
jgi:hypothetical protein